MWQDFQKDLLDFSLEEKKNGIYTEWSGEGISGSSSQFLWLLGSHILCSPCCYEAEVHIVKVIIFSNTVPPPLPFSLYQTKYISLIQFEKTMGLYVHEETRPHLV